MPILLLLFGMFALCFAVFCQPVQHYHYEHSYSAGQVKAMQGLVNSVASGEPDGMPVPPVRAAAVKLYRPKSEAVRLAMIKRLWKIEGNSFEIGSLK